MSDADPLKYQRDIQKTELSLSDDTADGSEPVTDTDVPDLTNAELVLLRVRVIALENILIAVLAEGSDAQQQAARKMAEIISPRNGATQHAMTIRAAQHMNDLVDRAVHIKAADLS